MATFVLSPASGTGKFYLKSAKIIRFARYGCANRPFFHIVVTEVKRGQHMPVIEQLGTYDPMPNQHNEKLVALNLERIYHWLGKGAVTSKPIEQLLGLAGFFPIHPTSYVEAWRARKIAKENENIASKGEEKLDENTN